MFNKYFLVGSVVLTLMFNELVLAAATLSIKVFTNGTSNTKNLFSSCLPDVFNAALTNGPPVFENIFFKIVEERVVFATLPVFM